MKEPLNVSSSRGNLIACHSGLNLAAITPDRERDPTSRRLCYSNRNSFRSRQAIILEKVYTTLAVSPSLQMLHDGDWKPAARHPEGD